MVLTNIEILIKAKEKLNNEEEWDPAYNDDNSDAAPAEYDADSDPNDPVLDPAPAENDADNVADSDDTSIEENEELDPATGSGGDSDDNDSSDAEDSDDNDNSDADNSDESTGSDSDGGEVCHPPVVHGAEEEIYFRVEHGRIMLESEEAARLTNNFDDCAGDGRLPRVLVVDFHSHRRYPMKLDTRELSGIYRTFPAQGWMRFFEDNHLRDGDRIGLSRLGQRVSYTRNNGRSYEFGGSIIARRL